MISLWLFEMLAAFSRRIACAEPFDWDDDDAWAAPSNAATHDFAWQ